MLSQNRFAGSVQTSEKHALSLLCVCVCRKKLFVVCECVCVRRELYYPLERESCVMSVCGVECVRRERRA